MNIWDYLLIAALTAACFFAWRFVRKHGAGSCGGDCSACAFSAQCKKRPKGKNPEEK